MRTCSKCHLPLAASYGSASCVCDVPPGCICGHGEAWHRERAGACQHTDHPRGGCPCSGYEPEAT